MFLYIYDIILTSATERPRAVSLWL